MAFSQESELKNVLLLSENFRKRQLNKNFISRVLFTTRVNNPHDY